MLRFRDLSIRKKLFSVFGISIVFIGGIILVGLMNMLWMKDASEQVYEESFTEAMRVAKLKTGFDDARRELLTIMATEDRDATSSRRQTLKEITEEIDESFRYMLLEENHFDEEGRVVIHELKTIWESFRETRDLELLPSINEGRFNEALAMATGIQEERYRKFRLIAAALMEYEKLEAAEVHGQLETKLLEAIWLYLTLSVAGLIVGLLLLRYLSRDIGDRVGSIASALSEMEGGDFDLQLDTAAEDEIGFLAKSFNNMSRTLYEDKVAQEQYVNVMKWHATEREKRAGELESMNEKLSQSGRDLASKNEWLEDFIKELEKTNKELEDTKAQMLQSEKLASIGQLAAGVAHEINNPISFVNCNLSSMKGYIEDLKSILEMHEKMPTLLRDGKLDDAMELLDGIETARDEVDLAFLMKDIDLLLEESEEGIERVVSIIRALKDFSHVDMAEEEYYDINKCLENAIKISSHEVKHKAVVKKELGSIPQVKCCPQQLNQVFLNLIINASQAISDKGEIEIRTFASGGKIAIEIEDNGAGMTDDIKDKLFEPFFTTKPVGVGTGLGLSIAYGIINDHGGTIDVESAPGEGTTFTISLPADEAGVIEAAGL